MDKPAPILIDNAEEWEADQILDNRRQNNMSEFVVHWKGYERADDSREPIENLDHSLQLIQEYWEANHPAEPTPQITSHYIQASWEPMEVSSTPWTANDCPDDFWEPYDMRNTILAALSRTISPQMTTASYGTPMRALRAAKTLE